MRNPTLNVLGIIGIVVATSCLGGFMLWGLPQYNVYKQRMSGSAEFAKAEQNRKIKIQEAIALKESAVLLAEAEVLRARGMSEAINIIGDSLKDNSNYLRYLWVSGLQEGATPQVIYVPTEAGIPIMEAGRMTAK